MYRIVDGLKGFLLSRLTEVSLRSSTPLRLNICFMPIIWFSDLLFPTDLIYIFIIIKVSANILSAICLQDGGNGEKKIIIGQNKVFFLITHNKSRHHLRALELYMQKPYNYCWPASSDTFGLHAIDTISGSDHQQSIRQQCGGLQISSCISSLNNRVSKHSSIGIDIVSFCSVSNNWTAMPDSTL